MKERVANQLFLFDMIEYSSENTGSCKVCVVDSISEEKQLLDYLYQGERILSLLREKEVRIVRHKPCDFFERFNISSYIEKLHSGGVYDYIEQTAIRQAREWWEKNDRMDVETNDLLRYLSKYLSIDANIITDGSKPGLKELIAYFFRKSEVKPKGVITIKSLKFRRDYEVPIGVKSTISKSKHLREYRWKNIMSDYYCIADAGRLFFMPLLLCVLKEQIQIAIQNLSETERSTNILYCYLINQMEQNVSKRCYDKKEGSKIPILLKRSMLERPFVRKLQLRYPNLLYIECEEEQKLDFLDIELLLFSWFLSKEEEDRVSFEVSQDISILHIKGVLEQVCDVYTTEKQMYEIMNELKKESAKVYQTKKNISLKCQKAMISSSFNHYFGYVELDDECDLEKFFVIEQQFQALSSYLFHGKKYEEVSIRFRKLGRHRAIGLYYPYIKCLVVDVRNTDSLSHEYFHMLDFENGRVSSNYEFLKVRECYQECFMQSLEESQYDSWKEKLNSKSKYNIGYYLTPTEIFARCGELYLVKIRKVKNSLVKLDDTMGFAYPEDERLLVLIKEYFDTFLQKI